MKKLISLLLAVLLLTALVPAAAGEAAPETWAVYLYICATDLESNSKFATANISALFEGVLPENVTFVLETGGTGKWRNETMSDGCLERWTVRNEGGRNIITHLGKLEAAPMSRQETLEDFLRFAHAEYPADYTMLVLWDHGGGTVYGACYDECFPQERYMPVSGFAAACKNVFGTDKENPPLDIIAFDCCEMATVDVAAAFAGCAGYMIASEDTVPGGGWNYAALVRTFAERPDIDPVSLGTQICNDYLAYYAPNGRGGTLTCSLTDLGKLDRLLGAYEDLGALLLGVICQEPALYRDLAVRTAEAECYGSNNRTQGYTNLIDLYDFASAYAAEDVEEAQAVMDAIDECVLVNVGGVFRKNSHGLSFYFPINGNPDELRTYDKEGVSVSFKTLYSVVTGKELTEEEQAFLAPYAALGVELPPKIPTYQTTDISRTAPLKNDAGRYYIDIGPEAASATVDAMAELYFIRDNGDVFRLGCDDDILCDFDKGVFTDNFTGNWLMINDWIAYSNLDNDSDEYHIYSVPFLMEDSLFYLQLGFDYTGKGWESLGMRPGNSSTNPGLSRAIFPKAEQTVILLQSKRPAGSDTFENYQIATLTYGDLSYAFRSLPDGRYAMRFRLEDVFRTVLYSDLFFFSIVDGQPQYD